jgi:hypothetical protein
VSEPFQRVAIPVSHKKGPVSRWSDIIRQLEEAFGEGLAIVVPSERFHNPANAAAHFRAMYARRGFTCRQRKMDTGDVMLWLEKLEASR